MNRRASLEPAYVPCSTYRLQLNLRFTFIQAAAVVSYLHDLGITDCYTSPFLMAHPGSMHGYDVTDHTRFNPEIGSEEQFTEFAERLRQRGMGLVVDVVPNHMCITHSSNLWWWDVLENGPSSDYSRHFDIDWNPPKSELANKVLLPVLGEQYGKVLEDQQLTLIFDEGLFFVTYFQRRFPVAIRPVGVHDEDATSKGLKSSADAPTPSYPRVRPRRPRAASPPATAALGRIRARTRESLHASPPACRPILALPRGQWTSS